MKKFLNADRLIALVCLAFAGYIWIEAGTFPESDFDAVGPSLYPRLLASIIGLASVVMFATRSTSSVRKHENPRLTAFLYIIALSVGYLALLTPLGFIPVTVVFLFAVTMYFDPAELKIRLRNAAAYSVLFSLFLYVFFNRLLGVLLPKGILSGLL